MLVRIWKKGMYTYSVLMGVKTGVTTMELVGSFIKNLEMHLSQNPVITHSGNTHKGT